jgi:hypothetical protein
MERSAESIRPFWQDAVYLTASAALMNDSKIGSGKFVPRSGTSANETAPQTDP